MFLFSRLASVTVLVVASLAADVSGPMAQDVLWLNGEAVHGSVVDLAYALAEARIPAGVLARDSSLRVPPKRVWHEAGFRRIRLADGLELFRAAHPDFEVTIDEGVVRIVERVALHSGPQALDLTQRQIASFHVTDVTPAEAFLQLQQQINPDIPQVGGKLASTLGRPGEVTQEEPLPLVSVRIDDKPIMRVLDAIVRQAPGTVWLLHSYGAPDSHYTLSYRIPGGRAAAFHYPLR